MITLRQWLKESFTLMFALLKSARFPLLGLLVVSCSLNIGAEDYIAGLPNTAESERWVTQLGLGIWDTFETILTLLILSWQIPLIRGLGQRPGLNPQPFQKPYLGGFLAEYLRMLAQVLMWGLLLLLPGLIRYCRLLFVPFVTLFSEDYRLGKVDALKASEDLTRPHFWRLLGLVLFTMAFEGLVEFAPELNVEWHTYPIRILMLTFGFLIGIWGYAIFYLQFEKALSAPMQPVASKT